MIHALPKECGPVWLKMDSFLSNELEAAERIPIGSHIEQCPYCTRELASRQQIRQLLQAAVRGVTTPPFLGARVRHALQGLPDSRRWRRLLTPALAGLLVIFGGSVAYELGQLRLTTASQQDYIASVSSRVNSIMAIGLRDHIECAIFRKYPASAPPAEELERTIGTAYRDLLPMVRAHVPKSFRFMMAHRCRSNGRRFLHLAFRDGGRTLSLVVTAREDGESFAGNLVAQLQQSGIPIYHAGVLSYQIDALETPRHLVYVISSLPAGENTEVLRAMAPELQRFFSSVEI